jgi:WD40 repeat protein
MSPFREAIKCAAIAIFCSVSPTVAEPLPRPNVDTRDEPLPEHAIARLGSTRFRHGAAITALALSADGKFLATGSRDRTVRIWDAASGKLLRSIRCESPYPSSITFSPDGKQVATSIDSENVSIFEWETAKPPRIFKAAVATGITWSKDGKQIGCAVADDDLVEIHAADTGLILRKFKGGQRIAFAPNGKSCAVAYAKSTVKIHDLSDGKVVGEAPFKPQDEFSDLRYSKDGGTLIASSASAVVQVWNLDDTELKASFEASGPVSFLPGDDRIAAVGNNNKIVFFDPAKKERQVLPAEAKPGTPFAFGPDAIWLYVGGPDNRVCAWNLTTGKGAEAGEGHRAEVLGLAIAADGKSLFSAGMDGIRLWDLAGLKERANGQRTNPARTIALAPNSRRFVTGDGQSIGIWEPVNLAGDKPYPAMPSHVLAAGAERSAVVAFAPDGERLVYADGAKMLRFADPARGSVLPGMALSADPLSAAFGPNGRSLAVQTRDGLLHQLSVGPRLGDKEPKDLELWKKRVQRAPRGAVAVSPDGLLVAASSAGRVVLLESVSGRQWYGMDRQLGEGDVQTIAFSRDNRLIAAGHGGADGLVRIWEVLTGKEVIALRGHLGGVNAVAFTPQGNRVVSGGSDSTILVWDLTLPPDATSKPMSISEAWNALDSEDTKVAYRAMGSLIREGPKCVEAIRTGLKDAVENQVRIRKLIKQLDEEEFRVRKAARTALDKEGLRAMPALRDALKGKLQPETERLIRLIIESMEVRGLYVPESGLFAETLRAARAIHILEGVGNDDAIQVLLALAATKDESRVTAEARAALNRLKK